MSVELDELVLDDSDRLAAADPGGMLPQVASSARQVRESAQLAEEAGIAALADGGRPRSVVVLGMGGSGIAGDVLAAVAGPACPVPIVGHKGYGLPGWVGVADLVIAVSCSGTTEETLSGFEDAARRGCSLAAIGAPDSPLAYLAETNRAPFVGVPPEGRQPRASMWALSVPLLVAGRALGLVHAPPEVIEATAARLEEVATRCRPTSDAFVNPAKSLAVELAGALPVVWGSSPVMGVAAFRTANQLFENAKYPALPGVLPEANHNQVVAFDGVFGAQAAAGAGGEEDFFRDRVDDAAPTKLRLILLRDDPEAEHPQVRRRAEASMAIAAERDIPVTELRPDGSSPLERLASLVGLVDYASVYLGIALGADPTPIVAIQDLKARIARR